MKKKGSMTIEASFLLPCIIIVILMVVFLMLYSYNVVTLWKNTYYIGIKIAEQERTGISYDVQQEWKKLSKNTLVLPQKETVNIKKSADAVTVTGEMEFNIPFWGTMEIQQKSTIPLCSYKELVVRLLQWK